MDRLIMSVDTALRTALTSHTAERPAPVAVEPDGELTADDKRLSAALMRVNHVGEVCAQALYQGQALTCRDPSLKEALRHASDEEVEHLAWTSSRIRELGGRKSLLNPLWYGGALALGVFAGKVGDRWNLGFLAETERQVEAHLAGHLERLPVQDAKSRAIVGQMKEDERAHADMAVRHGAAGLPLPVKQAMRVAAKVMTRTAYWV